MKNRTNQSKLGQRIRHTWLSAAALCLSATAFAQSNATTATTPIAKMQKQTPVSLRPVKVIVLCVPARSSAWRCKTPRDKILAR